MTHLVVVGGGIAGLAAAWEARGHAEITLVDTAPRVGGKIRTASFGGMAVEEGPDVFLARVPWGTQLAIEAGLVDLLVSPSTSSAAIVHRGRPRPIPEGLVLGVPTDLVGLARSGALSPAGLLRAGADLVLPRSTRASVPGDPTVAEVIGRRFGRQVLERLVAPLLGGINAGDVDRLSLASVAPTLAERIEGHRSLLLALRGGPTTAGGAASASAAGPVFHSLSGGLQRLPEALAERLADDGVTMRLGVRAESVEPGPDGGVTVELGDGTSLDADAAVVATPAGGAAALVATACPDGAEGLRAIEHASVSLLTVAYDRAAVGGDPAGSGFLVPRCEDRLMTACTHYSTKWADDAGTQVVLRISTGRHGDTRHLGLDDDALTRHLLADLADITGIRAEPTDTKVVRWIDGFPQHTAGHAARIDAIERALAQRLPAVRLAGAVTRGVGIPACILSGRRAAAELVGDRG